MAVFYELTHGKYINAAIALGTAKQLQRRIELPSFRRK